MFCGSPSEWIVVILHHGQIHHSFFLSLLTFLSDTATLSLQKCCWMDLTFHSSLLITQGLFNCCAYCKWLQISASGKPVNRKTIQNKTENIYSDLVSSGTLLLSTQLSCNWTDSGVVGPSPVPGAGAWMGFRPPLRVFLFRLLADWWDKVWWLCGGGSGGRSVVWLWWLAAPGRKQAQRRI